MKKAFILIFFAFICLVPGVSPILGQTPPAWIVNSLLDDPRGCPDNCTLRSAIASAAPGDVIGFSSDLTGTIQLVQGLRIEKSLVISGPGPDQISIVMDKSIEADIVSIVASDVTISGLSFRDGFGISVQGYNIHIDNVVFSGHEKPALNVTDATVLIENSVFERNTGQTGGGLRIAENYENEVIVVNSVFRQNKALADGGAIGCIAGTLIIEGSTFEANESGQGGGGIYSVCPMEIRSSQFIRNHVLGVYAGQWTGDVPASGKGGAIAQAYNGPLIIRNSVFSENSSLPAMRDNGEWNYGGAIYVAGELKIAASSFIGNLGMFGAAINMSGNYNGIIINSTFANNIANEQGGAIYTSGVTLLNTTIASNQAKEGGGVYIQAGTIIGSSIIANNTANQGPDVLGVVESYGYNMIGSSAGSSGWFASDQRDIVVLLGELGDNGGGIPTIPLLEGSPAIAAVGSDCPETDQRGVPRTAPCDAGAFEFADAAELAALPTAVPDTASNMTPTFTVTPQVVDVVPTATPMAEVFTNVLSSPGNVETAVAATIAAMQAPPSTDTPTPDLIATAVAATVAAMQAPAATPTATLTPDIVATYVAGTLTGVAPVPTSPEETPLPTATQAAASPQHGVLFEDDFTSDKGWKILNPRAGGVTIVDGILHLYSVNSRAWPIAPLPGVTVDPANFAVEIETFFMPTTSDQYIGFVVGDLDGGHYAALVVGDIWDYWNFLYARADSGLPDREWTPVVNKALSTGTLDYGAPLTLRLEGVDGTLRLVVNGHVLPGFDYLPVGGQIGLVILNGDCCGTAGTMDVSHIRVGEPDQDAAQVEPAAAFYANYASDFEQSALYWTFSNDFGDGKLIDGVVRIKAKADGYIVWNYVPNFTTDTLVLGVDISSQSSGDFNCGVIFNYEGTDEFYHFNMGNNGYYSLWSRHQGSISPLIDWKTDYQVQPSRNGNRVGVVAQNGIIAVYVNGNLLHRIFDPSHKGGQAALVSESYGQSDDPSCDFDNLVVSDDPNSVEMVVGRPGDTYRMP